MKKALRFFLILFVFALLCFNSYGHSGRTDSSGGHYNRSTGEYHYHHGYPAHQHTNGVCPYAAKTKIETSTGITSAPKSSVSNRSVVSSGSRLPSAPAATHETSAITDETEAPISDDDPGQSSDPSSVSTLILLALIVLPIIILFRMGISYQNDLDSENADLKKENLALSDKIAKLSDENLQLSSFSTSLKNANLNMRALINEKNQIITDLEKQIDTYEDIIKKPRKFTEQEIRKIAYIPSSVTFDQHRLPHCYDLPDVERNMHVYISDTGSQYHRKQGCSGAYRPMHLFIAASSFTPCHRCINEEARAWRIPVWYYRYLQLQGYNDSIDSGDAILYQLQIDESTGESEHSDLPLV